MTEFFLRQIQMMRNLCDLLEGRMIEPAKFVGDQWALIDLVKNEDNIFWNDYQSIVNEIELVVSIALDENGKLRDVDWQKIGRICSELKIFLKRVPIKQ